MANPQEPNPYDFLTNPPPAKKTPLDFGTGKNSTLMRGVVIGVLVLVLIIIFIAGFSFLNKSSNAQSERLIEIAQAQTEIVRISDSSKEKLKDKNLINKSISVKVTVQSQKNEVVSALSKRGKKVKDADLKTSQNSKNDSLLLEGEQNGRFDTTFDELLNKQLSDYQSLLEAAYDGGNKTEKELVESAFKQMELLNGKTASQ